MLKWFYVTLVQLWISIIDTGVSNHEMPLKIAIEKLFKIVKMQDSLNTATGIRFPAGKMSNDKIRMTNQIQNPKVKWIGHDRYCQVRFTILNDSNRYPNSDLPMYGFL